MDAEMAMTEAGSVKQPATVRVWDPLVRIFHWSLVGLFAIAFFTGDEWKNPHEIAGYVIAGLIALRVVWGVVGTRHARFSGFIYRPSTVLGYVRAALSLKAKRYLGHNPAGGAMVVALLLAISAIAATGYMMTTNAFWGVAWVEEAHVITVYATLGLIGLHVAGVVFASVEHDENLVKSMITGRKRSV
jgi:cytochrome b